MSLDHLQRRLAQLVRTGAASSPADHATADYLQLVARSTGLKVMRDVVHEWRNLQLRQACPLTAGALAGEASFAASVAQFMMEEPLDPLAQGLTAKFLAWIAVRRDDDLGSLAQFERALLEARRGTLRFPVTVHWRCHPMDAFAAALHGQTMPAPQPHPAYVTEIAMFLPDNFLIREISATHLRVA